MIKVLLEAFETLRGEVTIPLNDYHRRIPVYLIHRPFVAFDFDLSMSVEPTTESVIKRAKFEWRGVEEKNIRIYEFVGLE